MILGNNVSGIVKNTIGSCHARFSVHGHIDIKLYRQIVLGFWKNVVIFNGDRFTL